MDPTQSPKPNVVDVLTGRPSEAGSPSSPCFPTLRLLRAPAPDPLAGAVIRNRLRTRLFAVDERVRVGRFSISHQLGGGGMGVVYAGWDGELGREVAIKFLRSDLFASGEFTRRRLLQEAQAMALLSHPNVVQVYEVGRHEGRLFIVMELIRGLNLRDWLWLLPRSWPSVLEKYRQAGRGLAAAHRAGLVHRDFKPENALVAYDGSVRVTDFGAASLWEHELEGPDGPSIGTPAYMAPEQRLGGSADPRSDQFSFCVALWEALFGARPACRTVGTSSDRDCPGRDTGAPQRLRKVLRRGLELEPSRRFASMEALLVALEPEHRGPAMAAVV